MAEALRWYLALTLVGAGGLLPATLLFGGLRSAGVLYARPLALLAVAYLAWLAAAIGPPPYGTPLVLAAVAALWTWSGVLAWRRPRAWRLVWSRRRLLLAGELLFVALFALVAFVRAQAPAAAFTEKPMDFMLLQTVHEADRFPPADAWFAGRQLSYYHLGHTSVDVSARLAGVDTAVAFTLGVATAGALAGAAVFALAGDVVALGGSRRAAAPWVAGALAVTVLLATATLEGGLELLAANGLGDAGLWARAGVEGFPPAVAATTGVPDGFWWWWRATRVLPGGAITEFPAFSLVLGDLHAHLLALPLAVPAVALALTAFDGSTPLTWRVWLRRPGALLLAALLFAGLAMTNSWDAVLYGLVWLGAGAAAYLAVGWGHLGALFGAARHLLPPAGLALLLAAPYLLSLEHVPLAVAPVVEDASDPLRLALVWLPPLVPLLAALLLLRPRVARGHLVTAAALAALPVLAWVLGAPAAGVGEALTARGAGWLVLAALVAAVALASGAAATAHREGRRGRAAWLALAAAAGAIVLATELVYVEDAFGGRLNTVFKFWFGAWLLVATAAGAAAGEAAGALLEARRHRPAPAPTSRLAAAARGLTLVVLGAVFVLSLLYAPAAAISRAREGQAPGLDALAYLQRDDPGAAAALAWAAEHLDGDDVLIEAVGASYAQTNRLSTASGVPTVLAWPGHQRQWRGDGAAVADREADVAALYAAGAGPEALAIAARYGVTHVYLGVEERRQFGSDVAERFGAWPVAFEGAATRIVEVPREQVATP